MLIVEPTHQPVELKVPIPFSQGIMLVGYEGQVLVLMLVVLENRQTEVEHEGIRGGPGDRFFAGVKRAHCNKVIINYVLANAYKPF